MQIPVNIIAMVNSQGKHSNMNGWSFLHKYTQVNPICCCT